MTAKEYIEAVDAALAKGAFSEAGKMAREGGKVHPDDPEMAKLAMILAPPKADVVPLPGGPELDRCMDWFIDHEDEYPGQWVYVVDGVLQGHGPSFKEAIKDHPGPEPKGWLLTLCRRRR